MKKKTLVLDSSVMIKWVNGQNEDHLEKADQIRRDARLEKVEILAPELAKYEIGNALLNKRMSLPETKLSQATIYSLPITFIPMSQENADETIEIATKNNITFYDATFISLAKEKDAILITANPKHQRPTNGIKVINLCDYSS